MVIWTVFGCLNVCTICMFMRACVVRTNESERGRNYKKNGKIKLKQKTKIQTQKLSVLLDKCLFSINFCSKCNLNVFIHTQKKY